MNKITGINLNGNAYQLEEPGFISLSTYLAQAKAHLAGNPDQEEIMADLEQAIADKFQRFLSIHKTVITESEVTIVIGEMGPVDGDGAEAGASGTSDESQTAGPKRLYRVQKGEIIGGVANGVAAYLNVDVLIVRIIFVLLTIFTSGGFIFAYIIAMIFVPLARTQEEQAAASGIPFNAEELIARAKTEYAKLGDKSTEWRSQFRNLRKEHKRQEQQYRKWAQKAKYNKYYQYPSHGNSFGQLMGLLVISFFMWLGYHHVSVIHDFLDAAWNLWHRVADQLAQFVVDHDNG